MKAKTNTNHIGTLLHFDEPGYRGVINGFSWNVLPAINKLATEYELLNIGTFTQQVYNGFMAKEIEFLWELYTQAVDTDIKTSKFTTKAARQSLTSQIDHDLLPFVGLKERIDTALSNVDIRTGELSIVDSKPVADDEKIKERFSVIIQTEQQSLLYDRLQSMIDAWDGVTSFIAQHGSMPATIDLFRQAFTYDPFTNKTAINHNILGAIKS